MHHFLHDLFIIIRKRIICVWRTSQYCLWTIRVQLKWVPPLIVHKMQNAIHDYSLWVCCLSLMYPFIEPSNFIRVIIEEFVMVCNTHRACYMQAYVYLYDAMGMGYTIIIIIHRASIVRTRACTRYDVTKNGICGTLNIAIIYIGASDLDIRNSKENIHSNRQQFCLTWKIPVCSNFNANIFFSPHTWFHFFCTFPVHSLPQRT